MGDVSGLLSAARTQPQTQTQTQAQMQMQPQARPVPVVGVRNGAEVAQRAAKRAVGERKAKQEEQPQDFSIPKYVPHKPTGGFYY